MQKRNLPPQRRSAGGTGFGPSRSLNRAPLPSHKLQCFSVACLDMPHLEFGDKVVLPPKVLLELQCLKVPTPLLFKVQAAADVNSSRKETQYCSVQEFSAPDGQVFLPYWLMQSLQVPEGGKVVISSVIDIPRGIYCRLQPESSKFLDLAADIGPKARDFTARLRLLMETALRRYSILSVNATIVVDYGPDRYYVRVVELKPASVISLCGDVDLETDFMPPEGSDLKRPTSGGSAMKRMTRADSKEHASFNDEMPSCFSTDSTRNTPANAFTAATAYGRRLRDGSYVEGALVGPRSEAKLSTVSRLPLNGLQQAQQRVRAQLGNVISTGAVAASAESTSKLLAGHVRLAQRAFSTPGYTLRTPHQDDPSPQDTMSVAQQPDSQHSPNNEDSVRQEASRTYTTEASSTPPGTQSCPLCLADISSVNAELHTLRCAKNPAYHKFECLVCHNKLLRVHDSQHRHCPDCALLCNSNDTLASHQHDEHSVSSRCELCGEFFTRSELRNHMELRRCNHILEPCTLCGLAFKQKDIAGHIRVCSSRTEYCDICKTYINVAQFDTHTVQCGVAEAAQVGLQHQEQVATLPSESSDPITQVSATTMECVYCSQGAFTSMAAMEHHVTHECRIAKSFATSESSPTASLNQEVDREQPRFIQGRMRRKEDIEMLPSSLQLHEPSSSRAVFNYDKRTASDSPIVSTSLPLPRARRKGATLQKPKLKSRPQLNPLTHNQRENSNNLLACGAAANLGISSAGGTLQSAMSPSQRSRGDIRGRRKLVAKPPPPGRLEKLP